MGKISGYDEDSNPGTDSLVVTVDDPGGTPVTKRTTLSNLGKGIVPRGYIDGLILSNDAEPDNDINIEEGVANNMDNDVAMVLAAEITKQIDATWAAGDDAGGMNDGEAVGADTWYHVFLLSTETGEDVDAGFDTSVTAANLMADADVVTAGLTEYRRIGSVLTDGNSDIILFTQSGNEFLWTNGSIKQYSEASMGTNAILITLSTPLGIVTNALVVYRYYDASPEGVSYSAITSPNTSDIAASNTNYTNSANADSETAFFSGEIRTNTVSQLRIRSNLSGVDVFGTVIIRGWIDPRGSEGGSAGGGGGKALFPPGFINGLILANDSTPDIEVQVGVGSTIDSTDTVNMILSSVITKQIDATWDAGDDAGGMNDGEAVGNSTWYHVFLLSTAGGADVDMGFDTDVDATNLLADAAVIAAGLTKYRRLGSVLTDGNGDIILFTQMGDTFLWDVPPEDRNNANPGTNAVLAGLSIPLGIQTEAKISFKLKDTSPVATTAALITSPDQADSAASGTVYDLTVGADSFRDAISKNVRSDSSSQIRYRVNNSDAGVSVIIMTHGWIDPRGKS